MPTKPRDVREEVQTAIRLLDDAVHRLHNGCKPLPALAPLYEALQRIEALYVATVATPDVDDPWVRRGDGWTAETLPGGGQNILARVPALRADITQSGYMSNGHFRTGSSTWPIESVVAWMPVPEYVDPPVTPAPAVEEVDIKI